jgi:DNA helicase-2/ATP-dependent DNA helicase PcrA
MRQRAIALGVSAGAHISTFHSLCVRILRNYADRAGINPNFSIYDGSDQASSIKQAIKDSDLNTTDFPPARMLEAISTLKNKLVDVEFFQTNAEDFFSKTLARMYARYQHILSEHNALDFDDLLMKAAFLLRNFPDVCQQLGERFRFLLIDEYQDTNHAQYVIAKALVSHHNNICATGDPDQSIYRWRGADIRNILDFEKDWPDAAVVKLEKKLIPTKPSGKDIVVNVCEDETKEAQAVVYQIKQLVEQGSSLKDIAVFYRVNSMSRILEEAFIRNRMPYQIVRGVEFYGRKEIRDMLAYLKVLANPSAEIALLRIINTPARGIGKTTIDKIKTFASQNQISLFEAIKKAQHIDPLAKSTKDKLAAFVKMFEKFSKRIAGKVAPLAEFIFTESGLAESLQAAGSQGQDAYENVKELINAAAYYDQETEQPSLTDYLQQISLFSDIDGYDVSSDRVALMTLHAAKGLEFENVFIIGVEDGILPHARSGAYENDDDLEEERRLFFVGITRAKSGLHISYAKYRTLRGQMLHTIPSQFLFELGTDFAGPDNVIDSNHSVIPAQPVPSEACPERSRRVEEAGNHCPTPTFTAGQVVRHRVFGRGQVKEFIDMGENSVVVVKFNSGQIKSLMVKYANLKIV